MTAAMHTLLRQGKKSLEHLRLSTRFVMTVTPNNAIPVRAWRAHGATRDQ